MNPDSLCMGCMADTKDADVCPHCAYVYNTPAESYVQLAPRTIVNGKYLLGRVLGQGGFGITYLAFDLEANRRLAIKEYFPSIISTRAQDRLTVTPLSSRNRQDLEYGLQKFHEEGQALFRFRDHPNVVTMIEFFYANATGYIVMRYIEGRTFKEHLLSAGRRISFPEALQRLTLVMKALEDLHSAGILHRDVSPDNIYLENGGSVRILDFGATRYAMGEHSHSLSVILKPGYAPEEQYRSRGKQGPWTDIYALGATLYRAITGQVPPDSMDRQQLDDLAAPSSMGVDIPPDAEKALLKALAVKAEHRFQSIAEFREAITPQEVPVTSPPSKFIFLPIFAGLAKAVTLKKVHNRPIVPLAAPSAKQATVGTLSLHCAIGEFQGQDIEIGNREIVIGRDPSLANLVLSSGDISAKHLRVWSDSSSSGAWIEDLNSTNGTFYRESASPESAWSRLKGRKLLSNGDRFHVSNHAAEFEVKASPSSPAVSRETARKDRSISRRWFIVAVSAVLLALAVVIVVWWRRPNATSDNASSTLPPIYSDEHGRMFLVPAGVFMFGSAAEHSAKKVALPAFYIDETEVSNAEYHRFCAAAGHSPPQTPDYDNHPEYPVSGVSYQDATAYALWAGKRLPIEQEWEKAARGTDDRVYPWGDAPWVGDLPTSLQPVYSNPLRLSPYGAYNMAGNVWEWTATAIKPSPAETDAMRRLLNGQSFSTDWRVVKGGSFARGDSQEFAVAKHRGLPIDARSPWIGFRCVRNAPPA